MTNSQTDIERRMRQLGERLAAQRLTRNLTQQDLATEAAVSVSTVRRLEDGANVSLEALIRIMEALKLGDRLDALAPPATVRPMERVKFAGAERRRARPKPPSPRSGTWTWGDQR